MRILLLSPISSEAVEFIKSNHSLATPFEFGANITWDRNQTEVIITRSGPILDRNFLQTMPGLQAVIRAGVGIDNIDTNYLSNMSIPLYQISDQHTNSVAELAFGLFLNLARSITQYDKTMREGLWEKGSKLGMELRGKNMGIVGLGKIGMRLAEIGRCWGMEIFGCVHNFSNERRDNLRCTGIELVHSPIQLATRADLIAISLPLNKTTTCLVNDEFISNMKETAILVNVGRAATIDENALFYALLNKKISGAALDVHMQEGPLSRFSKLENVVLTPHIGSSTMETQIRIGREVIKCIQSIESDLMKKCN